MRLIVRREKVGSFKNILFTQMSVNSSNVMNNKADAFHLYKIKIIYMLKLISSVN